MESELWAYVKRMVLAGCLIGFGVGLSIGLIVGYLLR